MKNWMDSFI